VTGLELRGFPGACIVLYCVEARHSVGGKRVKSLDKKIASKFVKCGRLFCVFLSAKYSP